jgi:hypothetical protein
LAAHSSERRSSSGADDDSGEASALGVFGRELDKPKVSFALPDKPFSADKWFYTQHLVASVTVADSEDQHVSSALCAGVERVLCADDELSV